MCQDPIDGFRPQLAESLPETDPMHSAVFGPLDRMPVRPNRIEQKQHQGNRAVPDSR